ncbi:tRNA (guanine-N1)-methyltransferase [Thermoproteus tenax]|uniref:tRNA m(1)G methyltransferase n=1 Tax=Thermoproteus tenax (strain ATCC 35583 / DSM 2078 / JCM 9277 / NBRC 100435 / Kra 1) TaxID=768679 RepID=G4RN86_THETK|nr:tRNA (guanine-N1)-methyltransferase [Thermoproteus tenax]CCC81030.1 tRNA m(1)G methyltransferase [Thermoproteus tenax Kra 1]
MGYLGEVLAAQLRAAGVERIRLPRRFKCSWDPAQCAAVELLLGRRRLCRRGNEAFLAKGVCEEEIRVALTPPPVPKIYIDLGLWDVHTDREKNELVEQIAASIHVVRSQLWDGNLALARTPSEFLERFGRAMRGMRHAVAISPDPPPAGAVFLDPEGPCRADEGLLRGWDSFVVGGVVDKERVYKGASRRLAESAGIPPERRCRIELRGSTVGVPDRINKIIEILLSVRFRGLSLEDAILEAQAKRDKVYRLMRELQRLGPRVPRERALEIAAWLKAGEDVLELAARKARVELV